MLHYIDKNKELKPSGLVNPIEKEVGYTAGGKEISTHNGKDDNSLCYCKVITSTSGSQTYYIKTDIHESMYHPWSPMSNQLAINRLATQTGKPSWVYKKVNQRCFELYIKFLKTRNSNYYRMCERLYRNG